MICRPRNFTDFSAKSMKKTQRIRRLLLVFAVIFAICAAEAEAHDYWLEADKFFAPENSSVTLRMWLGTNLVVEEERFYQPKRTVSFNLISALNSVDLRDKSADDAIPVAEFAVGKTGTYLVGMERNPVANILDAEKFNDYLREENLTEILRERESRGETGKFGYERYSRFIKTLIQVGNRPDKTFARVLGTKLEIVPLENPYAKKKGDFIKFRILFNNQPLKNSPVSAYNRPLSEVFVRRSATDEKGEVRIKLDRSGFWLVRLVVMERCRADCEETDWESYWGSLSFAVR